MWLEAKLLITIVANVFIAIVFTQIFFLNLFLGFLLFVAIFLIVFGDIIIGYQIKHNHVDVVIDPCPSNQEICVLLDFGGHIDFLRTKKAPLGKREFVKYRKEASIINDGRYQLRFINGNHGFIGHESYEKNVDLVKAEALDKLEGDDLEEIFDKLPKTVDNKNVLVEMRDKGIIND